MNHGIISPYSHTPLTGTESRIYLPTQRGSALTLTWRKPRSDRAYTFVDVFGIAPGGGGGSGRKGAAATVRTGGAGGGSGAMGVRTYLFEQFATELVLFLPAPGVGGAAQVTNSQNGNQGTAGGTLTVTTPSGIQLLSLVGGSGGGGGQGGASASGGGAGTGQINGINGATSDPSGNGNISAANQRQNNAVNSLAPGGGSAGGGITSGNANSAGAAGDSNLGETGLGGTAGPAGGGAAVPLTRERMLMFLRWAAGGNGGPSGGSSITATPAGDGAQGGFGGGGGGGGAALDTTTPQSGNGGLGGDPLIWIVCR